MAKRTLRVSAVTFDVALFKKAQTKESGIDQDM
jgi:hypothetical protein